MRQLLQTCRDRKKTKIFSSNFSFFTLSHVYLQQNIFYCLTSIDLTQKMLFHDRSYYTNKKIRSYRNMFFFLPRNSFHPFTHIIELPNLRLRSVTAFWLHVDIHLELRHCNHDFTIKMSIKMESSRHEAECQTKFST